MAENYEEKNIANGSNLDKLKDAYSESNIYHEENIMMLKYYAEKICNLQKGGTCLDLGLGHGVTPEYFGNTFDRHVIIEGSAEIIADFKNKNPDAKTEIRHSFFEDFETDEKFDVIIMGFILEHVDDPLFILNKFKKFLKPDGSMYIVVPNYEALNRLIGFEAGLTDRLHFLSDSDIALGHKRLFTVETLREIINESGLKADGIEGIFLKPITTKQMESLNFSEKIFHALMKLGKNYPELSVAIFAHLKT